MIPIRRTVMRTASLALAATVALGAAAAEYRLGPADSVRIRLQEWPDVTGEYTVSPEGNLALPLFGELSARGLSVGELAQRLTERLRERGSTTERSVVAVEIVRFRPVFVLGDVQRAGDHAWRPGLTVMQAVALAGGFQRPPAAAQLRLDRDLAQAEGEMRLLNERRARLLLRAARLQAAVDGAADFAAPPPSDAEAAEIAALLPGEKAQLAHERARTEQERRSLEAVRAIYEQQIVFLKGQIDALKREAEPMRRQLNELKSLSGRGLAATPSLMSLERALAQNENEQLGVSGAIARGRESIEAAEQRVREISAERRRDNLRELQLARQELGEVESRAANVQALVGEIYATADSEAHALNADAGRRRDIVVLRKVDGVLKELPAADGMDLQPEDVVRVAPLPRRPSSRLGQRQRADLPVQR
jgi:protein involved in polysaccharide export with SLBB domain